jgi:hypothetical protein
MQPGRYEKRTPTAIAVMLTSSDPGVATELALTENISSVGARVVAKKPWSPNTYLVIESLEGDLQAEARVVYRQPIRESVYAVGLQLLAPKGNWRTKS